VRILGALLLCFLWTLASGQELEAKHATIVYSDNRQLSDFNRGVRMGSLLYLMFNQKSVEAAREAREKVDAVVERVQAILDMFPRSLRFKLVLLRGKEDVGDAYQKKFSRRADFIAFYSPEDKTVYVSVDDVSLAVLAHEIAHVVVDSYFEVSAPVRVHEVLAQYVEAQISP